MNIFIIGPENSGKTIFATMFNRYLGNTSSNRKLVFDASDLTTKKYFLTKLHTLEQGRWQMSDDVVNPIDMHWEWKYKNQTSSLTIIDSCSELKNYNIKENDFLIIVVDIYEHQSADINKKSENAGVLEQALRLLKSRGSVILAFSKADLLNELPESQWKDRTVMLGLLQKYMPEFTYSGFEKILNGPFCSVIAFSSLSTQNEFESGKLERRPVTPLVSRGFEYVENCIINKFEQNLRKRKIRYSIIVLFIGVILAGMIIGIYNYKQRLDERQKYREMANRNIAKAEKKYKECKEDHRSWDCASLQGKLQDARKMLKDIQPDRLKPIDAEEYQQCKSEIEEKLKCKKCDMHEVFKGPIEDDDNICVACRDKEEERSKAILKLKQKVKVK